MGWNPFERKPKDRRTQTAQTYAYYQMESARGRLAFSSSSHISVLTPDDQARQHLVELLDSALEAIGCGLRPKATVNEAVNSRVVLFDAEAKSYSRMHADYDQVLRLKKSMKKFGRDFIGAFGPRATARNYRRGTYGTLHYFCYDPNHPKACDEDIPLEGTLTVDGPILHNFADLPEVIRKFVHG